MSLNGKNLGSKMKLPQIIFALLVAFFAVTIGDVAAESESDKVLAHVGDAKDTEEVDDTIDLNSRELKDGFWDSPFMVDKVSVLTPSLIRKDATFWRSSQMPVMADASHIQSPNARCQLGCWYNLVMSYHFFQCEFTQSLFPCPNITRRIMQEARTTDPDYPYLLNATTLPRLAIVIAYGDIDFFEDGFLADFPTLYRLDIGYVAISKVSNGILSDIVRLRELCFIQCHFLSEIEDGIFRNQPHLARLLLVELKELKQISRDLFGGLRELELLDLSNNSIHSDRKSVV